MLFEFATATKILFGQGTLQRVGPIAARMGGRVFLATGRDPSRAIALQEQLARAGLLRTVFSVQGEPTVDMAEQAVHQARQAEADLVVAFGGGSAIDLGKVVAALLTNQGDVNRYLEVVGEGQSVQNRSAPWIAIPTTAGTGAEVTQNSVLGVPEHQRKVSMRSPLMLASVAVVDPEVTYTLPQQVTASTGLDALTQLIEPFVSPAANPLTDGLCREGIGRVARSIRKAYAHGQDAVAREDMAMASLFGGMALANAKLGAVHGLAGPLGWHIGAPHGVTCGRLLPFVMEANVRALVQRDRDSRALSRYGELGPLLTGSPTAGAVQAIQSVYSLCCDLAIPSLSQLGLAPADICLVADMAKSSSSIRGNPIELTADELVEVLTKAM